MSEIEPRSKRVRHNEDAKYYPIRYGFIGKHYDSMSIPPLPPKKTDYLTERSFFPPTKFYNVKEETGYLIYLHPF